MTEKENDYLKYLTLGYYVLGGLSALFSLLPLLHVAMGLSMALSPAIWAGSEGSGPPPFFGWLFVVMGLAFVIFGLVYSAFLIYAGRCLGKRKKHTLCVVLAAVACMSFPFGTVLGVFTLILLTKDHVKETFDKPDETTTSS